MNASSVDENVFEQIEQAIMQIGWLGQRRFMQLLSDDRFDLTVPQFHTLLHLELLRRRVQNVGSGAFYPPIGGLAHRRGGSAAGKAAGSAWPARRRSPPSHGLGDRAGARAAPGDQHARRAEMHSALTDIPPEEADELLRLLDTMLSGLVRAFEAYERPNGAAVYKT